MVSFDFTQTLDADSLADAESELLNDVAQEFGAIDSDLTIDIEEDGGVYRATGTVEVPNIGFLASIPDSEDLIKEYCHPMTYDRAIDITPRTITIRCKIDVAVTSESTESEIRKRGILVAKDAFETDAIESEGLERYAESRWTLTFTATIGAGNSLVKVPAESAARNYTPTVEWTEWSSA